MQRQVGMVRAMKVCMKNLAWEYVQMECGMVEWAKRNTVRWFDYIERVKSEERLRV